MGIPSNHNTKIKETTNRKSDEKDDDSKYDDDEKSETRLDPNYDILTISNLDRRVNEKIIQKIVNRKLCQNVEEENALRISLKAVSIICVRITKIAKIKLKKSKDPK